MHVVGHQDIGMDQTLICYRGILRRVEIKRAVLLVKKPNCLPKGLLRAMLIFTQSVD